MQRQRKKQSCPLTTLKKRKQRMFDNVSLYSEPTSCLSQSQDSAQIQCSSETKENINWNIIPSNDDNLTTKDNNKTFGNHKDGCVLEKPQCSKRKRISKCTAKLSIPKEMTQLSTQNTTDISNKAKRQTSKDKIPTTSVEFERENTPSLTADIKFLDKRTKDVEKIERVMRALFEMISIRIDGTVMKSDTIPVVANSNIPSPSLRSPSNLKMKSSDSETPTTAKKRKVTSVPGEVVLDETRMSLGSSQNSQSNETSASNVTPIHRVECLDNTAMSFAMSTAFSGFKDDYETFACPNTPAIVTQSYDDGPDVDILAAGTNDSERTQANRQTPPLTDTSTRPFALTHSNISASFVSS